MIHKCNTTMETQRTKIYDYEKSSTIQGESQFQQAIDEYLAQGNFVKRYNIMIVSLDDEDQHPFESIGVSY